MGVFLTLAENLARYELPVGMEFYASSGEEFGGQGTLEYLKEYSLKEFPFIWDKPVGEYSEIWKPILANLNTDGAGLAQAANTVTVIAGSQAFKKGFLEARPVLLEPIYNIEVRVPEDAMGDVMGDISSRRGKISGMEGAGRYQVIRATVPAAELHNYATVLRSRTGGRGVFRASMSHYEEVPKEQADRVIAASDKNKQADKEV